jgi:integrase
VRDINTEEWIWTVCRQTTPSPGELEQGQTIPSAGGGRLATATLRDATSWDEVVSDLGYEHLKRHGLRHTLTWMADAGVPLHSLRKIAGHGTRTTTQR